MTTLHVWDANGKLVLTEDVQLAGFGTFQLPESIRGLPVGDYTAQVDEYPSTPIEVHETALYIG